MATPGNNKVQIDTVVNAAGVAPGVAETTAGMKEIEAAAGSAGAGIDVATESTHSLQGEQLGSLRTSRHFVESLIQISEGGPQAAAGMAMLTRIFAEMDEAALGALGPAVLVISTLAAVGIPMLMRAFGDASEAAKKHGQAEEDAAKQAKEAWDKSFKAYKDNLNDVLALQGTLASMRAAELTDIAKTDEAKKKSLELDKQIAIEKARQTYLDANAATNDPAEQKRLKARFEATQKDIEAGTGVATAALDLQEKKDEQAAQTKNLADEKAQLETMRNQVQAMQDQRTQDAYTLARLGVTMGKDGLVVKSEKDGKEVETPALDALKQVAQDATQALIDAKQNLAEGAGVPRGYTSAAEYLESLSARVRTAQDNVEAVTAVGQRAPANSEESQAQIEKKIDELNKTVDDTMRALADLAPAIENATKGVTLANLKQTNTKTENQQNESRTEQEIADDALKGRQQKRDADRKLWQAQLDDKTLTPEEKARLQRNIDQSEVAGYRDKLDTDGKGMSDIEKAALATEIAAAQAKQASQTANAQSASDKAAQQAGQREDEAALREARGIIEGSGNKEEIAALKQTIATFKSNPQGAMQELISELTVVLGSYTNATGDQLSSIKTLIASLQAQVQSMRTNRH